MLMLPVDFDFLQFVNQKIRLVQKDGFVKTGILITVNQSYLTLKFENGLRVFVDRNMIVGVEEVL